MGHFLPRSDAVENGSPGKGLLTAYPQQPEPTNSVLSTNME